MTAADLRRRLLKARHAVLTASLPAYDETAKSFLAELPRRATETGTLAADAIALAAWYQSDPRAGHLPPMLCREVWEPSEDYANRMYAKGGYRQ